MRLVPNCAPLPQALRIRTIIGANHQQQIRIGGHVLDRDLPVFRGIANILRRRPLMFGTAPAALQ